jgi:hypothetical protein
MIGRVLKSLAGLALAGTLAWSTSPANATVKFDETGTGTFNLALQTLDWLPGNSIAVGGVTAVENFVAGTGSTQFTFFYQAKLGTFVEIGDPSPNVMPDGTELTIVVGLREQVIGVAGTPGGAGTTATFRRVADPTLDFLEVYYDDGSGLLVDEANNLIGQGFNDGQLILKAAVTDLVDTVFTVTDANAGPLDQTSGDNTGNGGINGDNDYPDIETVQGNGSTTLTAEVADWDTSFFDFDPAGVNIIQLTMLQNVGVDLPFLSVDPSSGFVTAKNVGAIGTSGPAPNLLLGPAPNPLGVPAVDVNTVGTLNGGASTAGGGPDIVFQTDTNQVFAVSVIPEPVTASLALLSLGALGLVARRRRA